MMFSVLCWDECSACVAQVQHTAAAGLRQTCVMLISASSFAKQVWIELHGYLTWDDGGVLQYLWGHRGNGAVLQSCYWLHCWFLTWALCTPEPWPHSMECWLFVLELLSFCLQVVVGMAYHSQAICSFFLFMLIMLYLNMYWTSA